MNTIIYKATNKINGKSYIGQTICGLENRKYQHIKSAEYNNNANNIFHNAIKKYGPDAFEWEIVAEGFPYLFIDTFEKYWINYYDTYNGDGYNMTKGGNKPPRLCGEKNGFYGKKHSKMSIDKMLEARNKNKEWLKKIQNKTEDHRNKISESNRKTMNTEWKSTIGKRMKEKRNNTMNNKEIPICPYCGLRGKSGHSWSNMKKHHFDNCKLNDDLWEEW